MQTFDFVLSEPYSWDKCTLIGAVSEGLKIKLEKYSTKNWMVWINTAVVIDGRSTEKAATRYRLTILPFVDKLGMAFFVVHFYMGYSMLVSPS